MTRIHTNNCFFNFSDEALEVKIPMPWGHISGKWWGPTDVRPILCLHGWQDNAGTFDTLIPLLPKHISYLAIDLPGHGLSSKYPIGMNYSNIECLYVLERIRIAYGWNELSIMAHSMGSIIGYIYCGIFPDRVDLMIGIDALKSHIRRTEIVPDLLKVTITKSIEYETHSNAEPPAYELEEMVNKYYEGSGRSVNKECCKYLLKRNTKESNLYPGKYYFARDNRWKYAYNIHLPQEVSIEFAKRMKMPYLFIKASNSSFYEDKKYFEETVKTMQEHNDKFTWILVEGTHHLHLTHPETVADEISQFINKYRLEVPKAKL